MLKLDLVKNPFYCYILSFSIVAFIYLWGWSDLYPALTIDVIVFLLFTFAISYILGRSNRNTFVYEDIQIDRRNYRRILFIYVCYIVEFADAGGIPLIMIASGSGYNYQDFGIPIFHILVQTIGPFYTVYMFHQYISTRRKSALIGMLAILVLSILIVNRGSVVMTCVSCLLLSIQRRPIVSKIKLIKLVAGFLLFFYGFGYIGNLRSFKDNEDVLLEIAQATPTFRKSTVPNEYFWLYLYAASPLANFQEVVNTSHTHKYNFWRYVNNEVIPDIIGRRFDDIKNDPDYYNRPDYLIAKFLTVGTMYFDSFIRMGWWGPVITFIYYMTFILFYLRLLFYFKFTCKYRHVAIAIVCTISVFNIFDNMTRGAGLLIQLLYPFIFGFLDRFHFENDTPIFSVWKEEFNRKFLLILKSPKST